LFLEIDVTDEMLISKGVTVDEISIAKGYRQDGCPIPQTKESVRDYLNSKKEVS